MNTVSISDDIGANFTGAFFSKRPKINEYRIMKGELVRIARILSDGRYDVERIRIERSRAVAAGTFIATACDLFTPATDPKFVVAAQAFEANRRYEEMDREIDAAWAEVLKWNGVLERLHDCENSGVAA